VRGGTAPIRRPCVRRRSWRAGCCGCGRRLRSHCVAATWATSCSLRKWYHHVLSGVGVVLLLSEGATARAKETAMSMGFLGDLAVALTLPLDRYPREGDDGIAHTQTRSLGGSVVNTAIVARRLGAPARMFVRLGSGPDGEHSHDELVAEGLDVSAVQWDDTEPTQTNVTIVTDGGQRTMFAYRGTSRRLTAPTAEQLESV